MAWLTGWNYRKSKTVNGTTAGAQSNYQMKLTIHKSSGTDTTTDIYLGTIVRDDFGDVRFTDSDQTTLIDYWIESYISGTSAIIWIEIPSIPASPSTTTIYIYYDNSSQTTTSNGDTTFQFFDDFPGTSLDTGKWTADNPGLLTVSGSVLSATGIANYINANQTFDALTHILESKLTEPLVDNTVPLMWGGSGFAKLQYYSFYGGAIWIVGAPEQYVSRTTYYNDDSIAGIKIVNSNRVEYYKNLSLVYTYNFGTAINASVPKPPVLFHQRAGYTSYWDWVRVRKFASPEPTFGSTGIQEAGFGDLYIESTPSGAEIYVDDTDQSAVTPNTITDIPIGSHTYKLTLSGYYDATGSFDIYGDETTTVSETLTLIVCPISPKYSGDTVTLKATPKDGIGPYYVVFRKNSVTIDPSRLGGSSNPITNAPEDIEITRIYTLDDLDISSASLGTIDFSVYIEDSCPTIPQSCTENCIINIGCVAPVCNFVVT